MKYDNFESTDSPRSNKKKIENPSRRNQKIESNKKEALFDFQDFKLKAKKILIMSIWFLMSCIIIFGLFKIVKWGKIFDQNYIEYTNFKKNNSLPTLIGERKLSLEDEINIKNFENKLNKIDIKVNSVLTSTSTNTFIYNVINKSNNDFSIKINFDKNIEDIWNSFVSVYFSDDIKKIENNKLEYIDVRYTSKVFYKLKGDTKNMSENKLENI